MNQPPTELGRELDAWLAEHAMGWIKVFHRRDWWWCDKDQGPRSLKYMVREWHPSIDPRLAVSEIVPAMNELGWLLIVSQDTQSRYVVRFESAVDLSTFSPCIDKNLAGAICLATAAALTAKKGGAR